MLSGMQPVMQSLGEPTLVCKLRRLIVQMVRKIFEKNLSGHRFLV